MVTSSKRRIIPSELLKQRDGMRNTLVIAFSKIQHVKTRLFGSLLFSDYRETEANTRSVKKVEETRERETRKSKLAKFRTKTNSKHKFTPLHLT